MPDPRLSEDPSWVLRTAQHSRICDNCDCHVRPGRRYFRMLTGELYCCECPPEGAEEIDLCDD